MMLMGARPNTYDNNLVKRHDDNSDFNWLEPGAIIPPAGICAGGSGQPEFLSRPRGFIYHLLAGRLKAEAFTMASSRLSLMRNSILRISSEFSNL